MLRETHFSSSGDYALVSGALAPFASCERGGVPFCQSVVGCLYL